MEQPEVIFYDHEIREIYLMDGLPERWTYPLIQPKLIEEAQRRGVI